MIIWNRPTFLFILWTIVWNKRDVCVYLKKQLYNNTIKSEDTQVLGGLRARPNEIKARSSRPTWKNCSLTVQYALLKCYTVLQHRDSSVNIPLHPDQHHCSDEAKWRLRGSGTIVLNVTWRIQCLSNASQHVPIYLQPFPSNSTRKFKSSPF